MEARQVIFEKGAVVTIKTGWYEAGKRGVVIGDDVHLGQWWTPVLWDNEDDPDWHKSAGLDGGI